MTESDSKSAPSAPGEQAIDLEQVARLVRALEHDLAQAQAQGGSGNIDALRAEVEALRHALNAHAGDDESVRERLHGVRDAFEESDSALFKGAQYIADIGRMLGM
jgi:hypothetical protein